MLAELVKTTTRDDLRLDGALFAPAADAPPLPGLDAVLLLHGVSGNFYGGSLFDSLTPRLSELGLTALRVNTRGHDPISWATTRGGPTRQGAAYEIVDHCRHDVAAWVDFLVARGCRRIGLLGHSLGAIKAIYAQAHDPHSAVSCIVAASPPRLSHDTFRRSPDSAKFLEALTSAEQYVEQGRPETLFQARFPFPLLISAAAYLDKYGPGQRYDILRFVDRVGCPLLLTYGRQELDQGGVAFAGLDQAVAAAARPPQVIDVVTIAEADHFYTSAYEPLWDALRGWLTRRFGG